MRHSNQHMEGEDRVLSTREVAEVLGCSHMMVSRAERSALAKLRKMLEDRGLTLQDFLPECIEQVRRDLLPFVEPDDD